MSRNSGVRVRTGSGDTQTTKPCRNCGVMMDDDGSHLVCLACGYRMEKTQQQKSSEATAWQKQVADLNSQQYLSAGQARGMQMMASYGPLRLGIFLLLGAMLALGPLQNLEHLINGTLPAPLAYETAGVLGLVLLIAAWVGLGQPGTQRILQRNILAALALTSLMALSASRLLNGMLSVQYGALFDTASKQEGMMIGIASVPIWWQAPMLLGGMFVFLGGLAYICHREGTEQMY